MRHILKRFDESVRGVVVIASTRILREEYSLQIRQ
jgi:hypothetical protein